MCKYLHVAIVTFAEIPQTLFVDVAAIYGSMLYCIAKQDIY